VYGHTRTLSIVNMLFCFLLGGSNYIEIFMSCSDILRSTIPVFLCVLQCPFAVSDTCSDVTSVIYIHAEYLVAIKEKCLLCF
jgi:hypothetical protein